MDQAVSTISHRKSRADFVQRITLAVTVMLAVVTVGAATAAPAVPAIVGGKPATISDLHWQVAIVRGSTGGGRELHCGGVLISPSFVLTAAHCVDKIKDSREKFAPPPGISKYGESELQVVVGAARFATQGTAVELSEIIIHDMWKHTEFPRDYDAALLRLKVPVDPSLAIRMRSLPVNASLGSAWVSGWGTTENAEVSQILLAAKVPLVVQGACNAEQGYAGYVSPRMLCAGYVDGGRDACSGDSGGPLVMGSKGAELLVGLVSWGIGCAEQHRYGVYTRIDQLGPWIDRVTANAALWTTANPGPLFDLPDNVM